MATPVANGMFMFDNTGAADEGPAFGCGTGPAFDLWYAYTAPANGTLNVETCGSAFDTRLEIYDDCMGSELACNDDSCGLQSAVSIGAIGGATYYIRVSGWNGAQGAGTLTVDGPTINDECADANPIAVNVPVAFDTTIATPSADAWGCTGNTPKDLWFSFTSTADFPATATTCGMANYDTRLEVYEGMCGALMLLDCNDDACSVQSEVNWMATTGTTYYIRVGGFSASSEGQGELLIVGPPPAVPNDICIGAIDLMSGVPEMWDNTMATNSPAAPAWACGGSSSAALDLWYSFTQLLDGPVMVDTEGSTGDTRLEVFSGSCGALALVDCDDDGGTGLLSSTTFMGAGGTTYYVRVAGFSGGVITDGMVTATFVDTIPNDDCSGATPVGVGVTGYSNNGATDSGVGMGCVFNGGLTDIWFTFTSTNTCPITIDFSGSAYDTSAAIYEGDCMMLTEVDCDDDGGAGLTSFLSFTAEAGTTYYLQVGGFNGASGPGMFEIAEGTGIGTPVCMGEPNSTGSGASLKLLGSDVAGDNDLTIVVNGMPTDSMGYVVTSMETILVMNPGGSQGNLCIASFTMGRFAGNVLDSGATGSASFSPDLTAIPTPTGSAPAMAGETRYFQHWYRDTDMGGMPTSNFSSAEGLTFN